MKQSKKVVIAMSGGVDSSVAAALLKIQGYQVIGMMLRLWSEPGAENQNRCCTPNDMALAKRVAAQIEIPFYAIDAKDYFYKQVIKPFINGYAQGITPNPCLSCNRAVRWEFLFKHALNLGADYLATGHYARLRKKNTRADHKKNPQQETNGSIELMRGIDPSKDQSYVLHILNQDQLQHALFPLGSYQKSAVRKMASDLQLPVADREDSQDLCFIGEGDYRDFLRRNAPEILKPGEIIDINGNRLGQHQGLAFFTIGQRKGLGLASHQPLYVIQKNIDENTLTVGPVDQLGRDELYTDQVNWISGTAPAEPFDASIRIRYKAEEVNGLITPTKDGNSTVKFTKPLRDITPGQAAVFYQDEICLGGGIIQSNTKGE
jgi:tRNA-specific 2-thiouridylase